MIPLKKAVYLFISLSVFFKYCTKQLSVRTVLNSKHKKDRQANTHTTFFVNLHQ